MKSIITEVQYQLLSTLRNRFENNMHRHKTVLWQQIQETLLNNPHILRSVEQMEHTGGEPDVVLCGTNNDELWFFDCAKESPGLRRSLCYDHEALESRKENKPKNSASSLAQHIGIELLDEADYRFLQQFDEYDVKTSSWIRTPESIRKLGGALFCDRRYNTVFTYHNGAESYYAARGFRGKIHVR